MPQSEISTVDFTQLNVEQSEQSFRPIAELTRNVTNQEVTQIEPSNSIKLKIPKLVLKLGSKSNDVDEVQIVKQQQVIVRLILFNKCYRVPIIYYILVCYYI